MNLQVTVNTPLEEIQERFQDRYPHLQLVFFSGKADNSGLHLPEEKIEPDGKSVLNHYPECPGGSIQLHDEMTVQRLEEIFAQELKVQVQIFRQEKDIWLQTTTTNHWTLKHQNDVGQQSVETGADADSLSGFREQG